MGGTIKGVDIERVSPGDGIHFPARGDLVSIQYVGTLLDGTKFDSSHNRIGGFVTRIGVGSVIRAWDEAIPLLSLGEKAVIIARADYAYGDRGFGPIPPGSTLRFEVELIKIN